MNRLVIKPRTPAVAVAISIVAGPPSTDSDGYEAIPEVIVVMDEVIVIMAMQVVAVPIAVPSSAACIPPRTAVPGTNLDTALRPVAVINSLERERALEF